MTRKERNNIIYQALEYHACLDRAGNAKRNRQRFSPLTVSLAHLALEFDIEHPDLDEILENT